MALSTHAFIEKVEQFINSNRLLSHQDKCLVAFSGGADSMALLLVLQELGYDIACVHCNFHLRGQESDDDEKFCKKRCEDLGVELHVAHFATTQYADLHGISIEMAARHLRYDYFERLRVDTGAKEVAVAHHRDDSVETVLLNLIRGTGIHGLTGISPRNKHIVRPLLCVSRADIENFLLLRNMDFVTDSSNLQNNVVRNKIRLDILPLMREINPSVSEAIDATASRLSQVSEIFDDSMKEKVHRARISTPSDSSLDDHRKIYDLNAIHDEYTLFYILRPDGFTPSTIQDIFHVMHHAQSGRIFSSSTHEVLLDRGRMIIQPIMPQPRRMRIPQEGLYVITDSLRLKVSKHQMCGPDHLSKESHICQMDATKVVFPLIVRPILPGDRFRPFGMNGTRLVSDFLTDLKMNLFDKRQQLVLTDAENHILWVIGKRLDNRYRLTDSSKELLRVEVIQSPML